MFLRAMIWLVLAIAAWWFLRPRKKPPSVPPNAAGGPGATGPAAPRALPKPEPMVDCARCGLHLPASEALRDTAARTYCSREHLAAGPARER